MMPGRRVRLAEAIRVAEGLVDPTIDPYRSMPHIGGENIESATGRLIGITSAEALGLKSGKYLFRPGDVLYSKIRPALNKVAAVTFEGISSADIYPLRCHEDVVAPEYLVYLLRSRGFLAYADKHSTRTNIPKVNREALLGYEVDLPPLPEQRRIATLLDKADAIRRKRQQAIRLADDLLRSVFLDMFGDPITNPKNWPTQALGDCADFVGGGTPSRDVPTYYDGDVCWATSKDMRGDELSDTQEHITPEAIANSATKLVPPGTILVVVKSKVLMHTLPVALACVPTCFGQDLKGIIPHSLPARYVAHHMSVGAVALLAQARGVNTEGLTLDHLRSYRLMQPPAALVHEYLSLAERCRALRRVAVDAVSTAGSQFCSIAQISFSEQL